VAAPEALLEHRRGPVVWITTPAFEATGRALGLPDPAVVDRLLAPAPFAPGTVGRAPTATVAMPDGPDRLHVRRVLHGGWWAGLWRGGIAGLGRVRRELALTTTLRAAGAPVPVAAFAVARREGLLWRAAVCTVHVEGARDGIRFLRSAPTSAAVEEAGRAIGWAVGRMHELGVRHPDLHLGNLLVRAEGARFEAWVIDLDGARRARSTPARRRRRECRRLARSLRKRGHGALLAGPAAEAFAAGYRAAARGTATTGGRTG
jgi:tRNA A-37 threonylcarbamoyl transferase component Bud32